MFYCSVQLTLFKIISALCGFYTHATHVNQTFVTPGFPQFYPNSINCEWSFIAPTGQHVEFVVARGRTEECCDRLEVVLLCFNF